MQLFFLSFAMPTAIYCCTRLESKQKIDILFCYVPIWFTFAIGAAILMLYIVWNMIFLGFGVSCIFAKHICKTFFLVLNFARRLECHSVIVERHECPATTPAEDMRTQFRKPYILCYVSNCVIVLHAEIEATMSFYIICLLGLFCLAAAIFSKTCLPAWFSLQPFVNMLGANVKP